MSTGWVAAAVRARAMARRRVGGTLIRLIAEAPTLGAGLGMLAGTAFERVAATGPALRDAEHGIRAEQLWELRVLAGWMPAAGTPLARALAARFELANIEQHRRQLAGLSAAPPFELGALATSWPRLAGTTSLEGLRDELTRSRWGDPGTMAAAGLHDSLVSGWLLMVASASAGIAEVSRWVTGGAALLVARSVGAGGPPSEAVVHALTPLIGPRWPTARSIVDLRQALPLASARALAGVTEADQLWRAESRLRANIQADGFHMLRAARAGPEPVLGALAVLAVDGWRVRAALACAATGSGPSEVLDVVA